MPDQVYNIDIMVNLRDRTQGLATTQARVDRVTQALASLDSRVTRLNSRTWRVLVATSVVGTWAVDRLGAQLRSLTARTWRVTVGLVDRATTAIRALLGNLTSPWAMLGAGAGAAGAIGWPLMLADNLRGAQFALEYFLQDQQRARQALEELQRFAADTPYEQADVIRYAMGLLPIYRDRIDQVIRVLRAFGDAASLTGVSKENMEWALYGFRQIGSIGKLTMEELRQVTENLLVPIDLVAKELGLSQEQLKDIASEGIPAARAMEAILRALEKNYAGGMARQMERTSGQIAKLMDDLLLNIVVPWGEGMQDPILAAIATISDGFSGVADTVRQAMREAGQAVGEFIRRNVEALFLKLDSGYKRIKNLERLLGRELSFGEQLRIWWETLVEDPFKRWWEGGGRDRLLRLASDVGETMGRALTAGILGVLGLGGLLDQPLEELRDTAPFAAAAVEAARAFSQSFAANVDFSAVADKLGEAILGLLGKGLTVFPGGAPATAGSWLAAGIDLMLLSAGLGLAGRAWRGIRGGVQAGRSIWQFIRGGQAAAAAAGHVAEAAAGGAALARAAGETVAILGPSGEVLATVTRGAQAAGTVARTASRSGLALRSLSSLRGLSGLARGAGTVLVPLAILGDVAAIVTSRGAERYQAVGQAAGGWGGAAIGAAIGSIIAPGVGTAVGAALGSLVGSWAGGSIGRRMAGPAQPAQPVAQPVMPGRVGLVPVQVADLSSQVQALLRRPAVPPVVNVTVNIQAPVHIESTASAEEVQRVLEQHNDRIVDRVAQGLARALREQWDTTPAPNPLGPQPYGWRVAGAW